MDLQMNSRSEYERFEQIISQFLLKTLHLILDSRIPSLKPHDHSGDLSSSSRVKKSDKWFNLALGDRPAALEKLQFWHRNLMDPMVIDIIIVQRELQDSYGDELHGRGVLEEATVETVIERWVVQYENQRSIPIQTGDVSLLYKKMYQKSIILLRCIYSMTRQFPAYKIYRHLSSSSQVSDIDIIYKVSSFADPFSREEEQMMKNYSFNSVEAVNGRLCVSVSYRSDLSDFSVESSTSFPPVIIADYVGSPATDPLRYFPSIEKVSHATSFSMRGIRPPSSNASQRPHSWSSGIHGGAAYMQINALSGSPPVYRGFVTNDDPPSPTNIQGQRLQNCRLFPGHHKTSSYEESLSPPFSPSSSPSPPTYHHCSHSPSQSQLRPESAPMAIPHPMLNRSPRYLSPNLSDPSRLSLPPPSPRSTRPEASPHGSPSPSPSGNRLLRKSETMRSGELSSGMMIQSFGPKVSKDSKDESGWFSGLISSGSSPNKGFSRSSSKLSSQDDLDVCDFPCPFVVDDVDTLDSQASQTLDARKGVEFNSAFSLGRKSQDAAVGALVHMLRTAPPLRQDSSCHSSSSHSTQQDSNYGTASGYFTPRKASDALEELKNYRAIKDHLLSKSGTRVVSHQDVRALPLDMKGRKL